MTAVRTILGYRSVIFSLILVFGCDNKDMDFMAQFNPPPYGAISCSLIICLLLYACFCTFKQSFFLETRVDNMPVMDLICAPLRGWGWGGGVVNCDMSQKIQ